MNADYVRTVQLLLAVAPADFDATARAMTGGTACAPSTPNWRRFRPGSTPLDSKPYRSWSKYSSSHIGSQRCAHKSQKQQT